MKMSVEIVVFFLIAVENERIIYKLFYKIMNYKSFATYVGVNKRYVANFCRYAIFIIVEIWNIFE